MIESDESIDQQFELHYGSEDESDLKTIQRLDVASISVTGTDWTTETLVTQMNKGNIELNPRFQRRDAWEKKRKSLFIESLILGLPVPQIVLAERKDSRGKYIVLDGKQRLLCLRQFVADNADAQFRNFKLSELEIRPDLEGTSFAQMTSDPSLRDELTAFENQPIRTVVVRNWKSEDLLFHVFLRLNRGSKPLSPQELRQALHPGPFLDFADECSTSSNAIREMLSLRAPDFRMRDIELVIRYFSFRHRLSEYRGNLKDFLDKSCAEFNAAWPDLMDGFAHEMKELEDLHLLVKRIFGPHYNYSKWARGRYERRFNRAVFDVIITSLTNPVIRNAVEQNPAAFETTFQKICDTDSRFVESIERTTKSVDATRYRLSNFIKGLEVAFNERYYIPEVG